MIEPIVSPLVSPQLADFVIAWEGYRAHAYRCSGNVWTIGYGTTEGVKAGDTIDRTEAWVRLVRHLEGDARCVDEAVASPLHAHERAALLSFVYNVGQPQFLGSTLRRLLRAGYRSTAAPQFTRWNRSGGKVSPGLVKRREAERRLFLFADYSGRP